MMAIDERVDALIDFDGTLIKKHIVNDFFKIAIKYQKDKKKVKEFHKNKKIYLLKEIFRKDSEKELIKMLSVSKGLPYSIVKENIKDVKLRNLSIVGEYLGKSEKTLGILSRNDSYLINDILESYGLKKQLYDNYNIRISDKIIANHFKQKNGVFTGEVDIIVNNKMEHLMKYPDLLFFGDWGDWPSCRRYKNFKNISWLF
ncbi:hypothetical protein COY26_01225 [Candidatus Woesearchaeota archaeon CG_4_10_14_0_2_um_filter_33_10]|nr:MAG: hypothetical protein AUJ83_01535 [Candidatus Woesearchaeota archaeon CG1_02_33_12]PIN77404.1 MAG: hypothetical protein COV14_06090 [Candidatus Woesearchaeota archaeon CG10_big_fil_rev_8_21_14_0_10_33_12]PIU72855.1 MAG: hypothetical protein COS79_00780 [Candidatus Woesearchaeota archaeon CG06_land_8_20_14_3_00_33_13]PIZ53660.1 MAG: hypothetical protein COY26_01225 [Candidatus Woesearchaeota archaeon CG_4_10_14_0_2_um_filter_33_10]